MAQLARASLGLVAFAMFAAACIITDVPRFEDEEQTAPKLLKWTAEPRPQEVLIIQAEEQTKVFEALVESAQDLEQAIGVRLYVDYGSPQPGNDVPALLYSSHPSVPPTDEPGAERKASATWRRPFFQLAGCHTFTLMVSHQFDELTQCPERISDSDEITWTAYICAPGQTCDPGSVDLATECPRPTRRCPDVADEAGTTSSTSAGGP